MTTHERVEAKARLREIIDDWFSAEQESDAPFDCYVGDETVSLMTYAAFVVINAVVDGQKYLERERMLKPDAKIA